MRNYLVKYTCIDGEHEYPRHRVFLLDGEVLIQQFVDFFFEGYWGEKSLDEEESVTGRYYIYNAGSFVIKNIEINLIAADDAATLFRLGI